MRDHGTRSTSRLRRPVLAGAALAAALGIGLTGALAAEAGPGAGPGDRAAAERQEILAAEEQHLAALAARAADPAAQAAVVDRKRARHAAELNARSDTAAAEATADWPTGIFADAEAPARGAEFLGSNRWVGRLAGQTLAVWAGRSGGDATLGRVIVALTDDRGMVTSHAFVDRAGAGSLRVVSARGVVVDLVDEHGQRHRFNAASGRFL